MPAQRRRPWKDEVTTVSIGDLSKSAGPAWRDAKTVALTIGDAVTTHVEIAEWADATAYGGKKRYLRCPRCWARAMVLGFIEALGWCCRACGRWKSRDRSRLLRRRQSAQQSKRAPSEEAGGDAQRSKA